MECVCLEVKQFIIHSENFFHLVVIFLALMRWSGLVELIPWPPKWPLKHTNKMCECGFGTPVKTQDKMNFRLSAMIASVVTMKDLTSYCDRYHGSSTKILGFSSWEQSVPCRSASPHMAAIWRWITTQQYTSPFYWSLQIEQYATWP